MSEWQELKLDELGKVARGKSKHRPRNASELFGGKYPFVQTGDIKEANFYVTKFSQTYSESGLAQSKLWEKGTLCITIAANIAETAVLGIDACFPDSIIGFLPYPKKSDVCFIKYQFDLIKKHLQSISQGTTQDNLSQKKLLKFNFKVPPLPEQKRIASILSAYDELIENNSRRIAILEQMAEQIYKEWFVRMRFPGYENAEFKKGVPKGWEWKKVTEILSVLSGGTPKTEKQEYWDGDICWFAPTYIQNSFYVLITIKKITESGLKHCNSKLYPKNTIFITARGSVGNCVLNSIPMAMNQSCYALIGKEGFGLSQYYLYLLVRDLVNGFKQVANGAVFDTITVSTFERTKIILPLKSLIEKFTQVISPAFIQMEILLQQKQNLKQTRDLLLPRLISGKLRVKEAEKELGKA